MHQAARICILTGPHQGDQRVFDSGEIHMGRDWKDETIPSLDLTEDKHVSRRHVRVLFKQGEWFLEDMGSRHGTRLAGNPIQGQGLVRLLPGQPVITGSTTWALFPLHWLFYRAGPVLVYAPCSSTINYALYHCGVPIVGKVEAVNLGTEASMPVNLKLRIPGCGESGTIRIPPLGPGVSVSLDPPSLLLYAEVLRQEFTPLRARVDLREEGESSPLTSQEVTVTGFWTWSHEESARRSIVAFVSPHSSVVETIVDGAQRNPLITGEDQSFAEFLRSAGKDLERQVMRAIYEELAQACRIVYEAPKVVAGFGEATFQAVRPPHRLFSQMTDPPQGRGTCLDLSLLVSGCLENVGLCPLIIFTGKESGPEHAFAGCWVGSTPGPRPIVDRDTLIRESDRGNLLVLECTGVAEGVPWEKGRLSFQDAEKSAEDQLRSAAWVCAVDVGALRPPCGTITPMDSALQPEVAKAYDAAKGFARSKRGRTIGTLHLLYGILSSEGELIRELLAELGLQAERVREALDGAIQPGTGTGAPVETRNVTQIRSIAEGEARRVGSSSVRESELLWAFLERCEDSKSFPEIWDRIGLDVTRLRRSLARKCPRQVPLMESSVFVMPSKQQTIL